MSDNPTRPPANGQANSPEPLEEVERERSQILQQLEEWLEIPVLVLGFIWLILMVVELIWGLNPFLNALVFVIWAVFILGLFLRLFLAPEKTAYLKKNCLTAHSLFFPTLRTGRIKQLAQISNEVAALREQVSPLRELLNRLPRGPTSLT